LVSGDFGFVGKENFQELREKIGDIENMLKAMIKPLETNT